MLVRRNSDVESIFIQLFIFGTKNELNNQRKNIVYFNQEENPSHCKHFRKEKWGDESEQVEEIVDKPI